MIVDTRGIEVNETTYINKVGTFLFRIEKFEETGYTQNGDAKFDLHFKGVEQGTKAPVYMHREMFSVGEKSLWKIKLLERGLNAPEVYDINDFVGRYVLATIISESYTKKDGTTGTGYKVNQWGYSSLNDSKDAIPTASVEQNTSIAQPMEVVVEEVDESSIPFN